MNDTNRLNPILILGDVTAFLLFALTGLRSHDEGATLGTLVRVIVPFLGAWLPIAYAEGRFRQTPSEDLVTDVAKAWLPAWVIGLAIRFLVFDRSFAPAFAIISFLVNFVLLVGWRSAYGYLRGRSQRHA